MFIIDLSCLIKLITLLGFIARVEQEMCPSRLNHIPSVLLKEFKVKAEIKCHMLNCYALFIKNQLIRRR